MKMGQHMSKGRGGFWNTSTSRGEKNMKVKRKMYKMQESSLGNLEQPKGKRRGMCRTSEFAHNLWINLINS